MPGSKNKKARKAERQYLKQRRQALELRGFLADTPEARERARELAGLYGEQLRKEK